MTTFARLRRLGLFVGGVVFLAMWVLYLVWSGLRPLVAPAPFAFTDHAGQAQSSKVMIYPADHPTFCMSGARLRWRIYVTVNEVPVSVESDYAIRNVASGRAVARGIFSLDPAKPRDPFTEPTKFTAPFNWPLPSTIPPGRYIFEVVGQDGIRASNGFNVPFTVFDTCGGPR